MRRPLLLVFLLWTFAATEAQQISMSVGLFTGITGAYTSDKGISNDPRYKARYEARLAPIGLNLGVDYEAFGLMLSPGLTTLGQNFYVLNTLRGQIGLRTTELKYLNVPVSFKVHLFKTSFIKVSVLASFGTAFLLSGKEELSHDYAKIQFPPATTSILPPGYTVEYDGVLAPEVNDYPIAEKEDFKSLQLFVGTGFRTDWDVSNSWRISLDLRMNYGLLEPRSDEFVENLKSTTSLYQMPGERRDMFAQLSLGISKYIEFDRTDKDRQKKLKGTTRQYTPTKYPGQKSKTGKPKG
jgi:hypothetical protein